MCSLVSGIAYNKSEQKRMHLILTTEVLNLMRLINLNQATRKMLTKRYKKAGKGRVDVIRGFIFYQFSSFPHRGKVVKSKKDNSKIAPLRRLKLQPTKYYAIS